MTDLYNAKKKLVRFGLTEKQADIYLLLLRVGNMRIAKIVRQLHIPRSSVYENLRSLFEMGLAEEVIENSYKIIRAYPIGSIRHRLDESLKMIQKQTQELETLEKVLDVLPGMPKSSSATIRYYKDRAGARQLFWNSLKATGEIYVYSEWGRGRYLGPEFYKKFVEQSQLRGFNERVITNSTPSTLKSIKQHLGSPLSRTPLSSIHTIPADKISIKGETLMYDDTYAQVFLKDEVISGFEIQSTSFVKTQRAIFETLWEQTAQIS